MIKNKIDKTQPNNDKNKPNQYRKKINKKTKNKKT